MKQTNIYQFKVGYYGNRKTTLWYPPIEAQTYEEALQKVYYNPRIESADLKVIVLTNETEKHGRDLYTPGNWDIQPKK